MKTLSRMSLAIAVALALALAAPAAHAVPTVTEFELPTAGAEPQDIVQGSDGNVWFTERKVHKIGRVTPDGAITEFDTPDEVSNPDWITVGPDGNIWFTGLSKGGGAVGRMPPGNPAATVGFDDLLAGGDARGIAVGPDGNLWVVDAAKERVVRITTEGKLVPSGEVAVTGLGPRGITRGPDGNMWVAGFGGQKIGRITPVGVFTAFEAPAGVTPYDVVGGPDGNVWYAAQGTNVGRVTPAGVVTNFTSIGVDPFGIALGPDGALWYAEFQANAIGRMDVNGVASQVTGLTPSKADPKIPAGPRYATAGPGNTVWFTEETGNRVGRISGIDIPVPPTPQPPVPMPPLDTKKPVLTRTSLSRAAFRSGTGAKIRFTLSEPATVRFRIDRKRPGKLSKGRCVKPKRSLRNKKRCTRFAVVGAFRHEGKAGRNTVTFSGRFGKRALKPGFYRLLIGATDAASNRSRSKRLDFAVTQAAKKKPKRR